MENQIIEFQEVRDFSSKVNVTYFFIKQNFRKLAKSLLFFSAPMVILGSILFSEMFAKLINLSVASRDVMGPGSVDEYFTSSEFILKILLAFGFMMVGGVFTVATTYGFFLTYDEQKTTGLDLGAVWKKTRSIFWYNFGAGFFYVCGAILAMFIMALAMALFVFIFTFLGPYLIFIVYVAYYIFLYAFGIFFSMTFIICSRERVNFFTALGRLFKLAKGHFWNTVIIGFVHLYVQSILTIVAVIPWYLYLYIFSLHSTGSPSEKAGVFSDIISTSLFSLYGLCSILLMAFPLIGMAFQYYNLVELKEARGLLKKIEEFGSPSPVI